MAMTTCSDAAQGLFRAGKKEPSIAGRLKTSQPKKRPRPVRGAALINRLLFAQNVVRIPSLKERPSVSKNTGLRAAEAVRRSERTATYGERRLLVEHVVDAQRTAAGLQHAQLFELIRAREPEHRVARHVVVGRLRWPRSGRSGDGVVVLDAVADVTPVARDAQRPVAPGRGEIGNPFRSGLVVRRGTSYPCPSAPPR